MDRFDRDKLDRAEREVELARQFAEKCEGEIPEDLWYDDRRAAEEEAQDCWTSYREAVRYRDQVAKGYV